MTDQRVTCHLNLPNREHFFAQVRKNARYAKHMVSVNMRVGRSVAICGAGPSLATTCQDMAPTDEVWACNSALPYLWDRGVRVTHGVTIDQHDMMLADHEFGRALPVRYVLASSVHPALVERLVRAKRHITFFHSFLGIDDPENWKPPPEYPKLSYEMWLYTRQFPTSIMAGHGLNSVPRALCVAMAMGFDRIDLYGADCAAAPTDVPMPPQSEPEAYTAWLGQLTFYADGRKASVYGVTAIAEGVIDGRVWHTRADMVISAMHLVELQREAAGMGKQVRFIGDVLPAVVAAHYDDEQWMRNMPKLTSRGAVENFGFISGARAVA